MVMLVVDESIGYLDYLDCTACGLRTVPDRNNYSSDRYSDTIRKLCDQIWPLITAIPALILGNGSSLSPTDENALRGSNSILY